MDVWVMHALFGTVGGAIVQFLGMWKLRMKDPSEWPIYYKSQSFILLTIGMVLLGGFVAWLQLREMAKADYLLALQLGATAPLILERYTANSPPEIAV